MTTLNLNLNNGINILVNEMARLNNHINENGQIGRSTIIKGWHSWTNQDWADLLAVIFQGEQQGHFKLPEYIMNDVETLFDFVLKHDMYHENVLYPNPKDRFPKALKEITVKGQLKTVKSLVFRVMMNIREAYCVTVLDKAVPNEDSSLGILNPIPGEELFDYGN